MEYTLVGQTCCRLHMTQIEELHLGNGVGLIQPFSPVAQFWHGVHVDRLSEIHRAQIKGSHFHLGHIQADATLF